ncbi:hypothetical protein EYF80_065360 [Liparis tanakae]|uniref:Uncharacterized protein n=1 Tax=Liparis tanakae TaxID=230148 RepID=A0A4Z2E7I3_9TELE|nr:hypothetical protein EYF80_065360 [Liparis tanakae]
MVAGRRSAGLTLCVPSHPADDKEQLPHLLAVSESRSITAPLSRGSPAAESRLWRLASYQTLSEKQWPDDTLYSTQSVRLGGSD